MDTLTTLFCSEAKVKLLRLFLFNQDVSFHASEIVMRTQVHPPVVRRELNTLLRAGFIKKRIVAKSIETRTGSKVSVRKVSGPAFILNDKFPYLEPLKNLLTVASISADDSLTRRFANAGRVKLLIAAGVFIQNWDSRVDLLVVGDDINLSKIEYIVKDIESEVGKEIAYSAFETQDFEYRVGIHDRLVRDILDYPHVTLLDRLGIEVK